MNRNEFQGYNAGRKVRKAVRDANQPDAFLAELARLHRIQQACHITIIVCVALTIAVMLYGMYWRAAG